MRDADTPTDGRRDEGRRALTILHGWLMALVTLVHGTFAKSKRWCMPGSPMWRAIEDAIPGAQVYRFDWGGENRHSARIKAGDALARHIVNAAEKHPGTPHFLVCHSHGGNVALYALRSPEVERLVCGIVCLATPFVDVSEGVPVGLLPRLAPWMVGIAALTVGAIAMTEWGVAADRSLLGLFVTFCIYPLLIARTEDRKAERRERWLALLGGGSPPTGLRSPDVAAAESAWRAALAERVRPPRPDPARIVIVRSRGDEASLALAMSQLAAWIARVSISVSERIVYGPWDYLARRLALARRAQEAAMIALALAVVATFAVALGALRDPLTPRMSTVTWAATLFFTATGGVWLVAVLLVLVLSGLLRVSQLAFGVDGFIWARYLLSYAESSPPGSYAVHRLAEGLSEDRQRHWGRTLAHSQVTEHPAVVRFAITWILSRISTKG